MIPRTTQNLDDLSLEFEFRDQRTLKFELAQARNLTDGLALHGTAQKIGDSYAGIHHPESAAEIAADIIAPAHICAWR